VPENAAVTGVAKGALGTDTALEDTQEWVISPELQAPVPQHAAESAPAAAAAASSSTPSKQAPTPAALAVPVSGSRPTSRRVDNARGGFAATPRAAGLAAVALLALVGVAAVVTSQDGNPGAGAAPVDQATIAPTAAPPGDAGSDSGGNGNDKKDKDKGGGNGNKGEGNGRD